MSDDNNLPVKIYDKSTTTNIHKNIFDPVRINQPKISISKSNDLSRLDSSILSSKKSLFDQDKISQLEKQISNKNNNLSSNINENDLDDILENPIEDKKDTNFSSEKVLYDEMNKAEKFCAENKK